MLVLFCFVFVFIGNINGFNLFPDMVTGPVNFNFHSFINCATEKTPTRLFIIPSRINKTHQVISGNFSTDEPIGDNVLAYVSAYLLRREKWTHLANLSSTVCHGLRTYVGPIRDDILRGIGLMPDTCPIPRGAYRFANLYLDWKKSRLPPAFPYGTFKILLNLNDKRSKALYLCLEIELENKA